MPIKDIKIYLVLLAEVVYSWEDDSKHNLKVFFKNDLKVYINSILKDIVLEIENK